MSLKSKRIFEWVAIIAFVIGLQWASGGNLVKGQPPALSGSTLQGQNFDLSQFRGKTALIYFWGSWCGICRAMQSSIQSVAQDHPFISVALQSGDAKEVSQYMADQGLHVPTLLDPEGRLSNLYGLRGVPALFILNPQGQIRYATTGYTSELGIRFRLWLAGR